MVVQYYFAESVFERPSRRVEEPFSRLRASLTEAVSLRLALKWLFRDGRVARTRPAEDLIAGSLADLSITRVCPMCVKNEPGDFQCGFLASQCMRGDNTRPRAIEAEDG